jgi:hypothetical protein
MLRAFVVVLAVAMAGCGGGDSADRGTRTTPKGTDKPKGEATATPAAGGRGKQVTREESQTIRGWASALRRGHVDRAVRYWAVPAVFSNGDPPVKLPSVKAIRAINAGFPCGAKVISTRRDPHDHDFVDAVFVLTERRGGSGCDGTGNRAATAFRIRDHKIAEWLRLPDPDPQPAAGEDTSSS